MASNAETDLHLTRCDSLYLRMDTPKGRGVFTRERILSGTIVEVCPVLILSSSDAQVSSRTLLDSYTYNWPDPKEPRVQTQAIVLGLGSMFNHSRRRQNVGWSRLLNQQVITYTALRDIDPGEELCINYGKVWFDDTDEASEDEDIDSDVLGRIEDGIL